MKRGIGLAFGAAAISGVAVFINGYGVRAVPDATVYTDGEEPRRRGGARRARCAGGSGQPYPPEFDAPARLGRRGYSSASPRWASSVAACRSCSSSRGSPARRRRTRRSSRRPSWCGWRCSPCRCWGSACAPVHLGAVALLLGGLIVLDDGLAGFAVGTGEAADLRGDAARGPRRWCSSSGCCAASPRRRSRSPGWASASRCCWPGWPSAADGRRWRGWARPAGAGRCSPVACSPPTWRPGSPRCRWRQPSTSRPSWWWARCITALLSTIVKGTPSPGWTCSA